MKHLFKYHVEDLPALEEEYQEVMNKLRAQRDTVANLKKDDQGHQIETSMLLSLNRKAEELKDHIDHLRKTQDIGGVMDKLDAIMDKNNCLRVRFYDWLAAKLERLAARIREHAINISKPCVVKLPRKKDESRWSLDRLRGNLTETARKNAKKEAELIKFLDDSKDELLADAKKAEDIALAALANADKVLKKK